VQFLRHHGYTELDMGGVGLIMADTNIEFKNELFYGEALRALCSRQRILPDRFRSFLQTGKRSGREMDTGRLCPNRHGLLQLFGQKSSVDAEGNLY